MTDNSPDPKCKLCGKPDTDVPLLKLSYNSNEFFLCAEHMPTLIHKPAALIGKLPGAENMPAG